MMAVMLCGLPFLAPFALFVVGAFVVGCWKERRVLAEGEA